jgi:hypothetical protein
VSFAKNLEPFLRRSVERAHHQMEVRGERAHTRNLTGLGAYIHCQLGHNLSQNITYRRSQQGAGGHGSSCSSTRARAGG